MIKYKLTILLEEIEESKRPGSYEMKKSQWINTVESNRAPDILCNEFHNLIQENINK